MCHGSLTQWFSTGGDPPRQGHLAVPGDIFDCHSLRGEAKDAAEHPPVPRAALTTKNDLDQDVGNAKVKRPWSGEVQ